MQYSLTFCFIFQLCNYSRRESGQKLILQDGREPHYGKMACSICVSCVLSDNTDLLGVGAALCYNLSLFKVTDLYHITPEFLNARNICC